MKENWRTHYEQIKVTPEEPISVITSGKRVFMETNCSEPLSLIDALIRAKDRLEDVEIVSRGIIAKNPVHTLKWE